MELTSFYVSLGKKNMNILDLIENSSLFENGESYVRLFMYAQFGKYIYESFIV